MKITLVIGLLLTCLPMVGTAQVKSAEELVQALKPKPLTRGLRIEDAPKPSTDVTINFEFNSAKLSSDSQEQLSELAKALNNPELKDYKFKITGHTDAVGSDVFNLTLSKRRAGSVLDYLASRYQVSFSRLVSDGMGKRLLKYPHDPENGGNRRVEITQMGQK